MQAVRATKNVVLHAAEAGRADGSAVVFINSLGTDLRIWDAVVGLLAPEFRLIRYDKRGHGLSGWAGGACSIADHAADLLAVLDHFAVARAAVVGLSIGGQIALQAIQAAPQRVERLVLCDTAHRIGSAELWDGRIVAITNGGIEAVADGIVERWFSKAFRSERRDELALWRAMLTRSPRDGYIAACAAIRDVNLESAARSVRVPTLCLCGSEDLATPPALMAETAKLIAGANLDVIDGSGHLPCIDNPGALGRRLTSFLKGN